MEKWLRSTALRMLYSRERLILAMQDRTPTNAKLPENLFRPCGSHAGTMRAGTLTIPIQTMRKSIGACKAIIGCDKCRRLWPKKCIASTGFHWSIPIHKWKCWSIQWKTAPTASRHQKLCNDTTILRFVQGQRPGRCLLETPVHANQTNSVRNELKHYPGTFTIQLK